MWTVSLDDRFTPNLIDKRSKIRHAGRRAREITREPRTRRSFLGFQRRRSPNSCAPVHWGAGHLGEERLMQTQLDGAANGAAACWRRALLVQRPAAKLLATIKSAESEALSKSDEKPAEGVRRGCERVDRADERDDQEQADPHFHPRRVRWRRSHHDAVRSPCAMSTPPCV